LRTSCRSLSLLARHIWPSVAGPRKQSPFRGDATPNERRRSFKVWPWWKRHVEALYCGELERARAKRTKGPHDYAERAVADALRVWQGTVHAICGEIRAMRREDAESANLPPMALA
jgi:hypothetical protein